MKTEQIAMYAAIAIALYLLLRRSTQLIPEGSADHPKNKGLC